MAREKDITETGPKALRGIRNPDLYKVSADDPIDAALPDIVKERLKIDLGKAVYRNYDASTGRVGYSAFQDPSLYEPQLTKLDYGSSSYDSGLLLNPDQGDIQDKRANAQSGFLKIVNGLAKGAVLATTTFLDGTVGLALGAGTAISEGRWSGLWDNDFSKAMQAANEWSEKALPNYYTQDEQNNPWDHIFSANFIGDKFIKNLGFTVGALYGGGVISGGVRGVGKLAMAGAKRLGSTVSTIKNISNATTHVATGVGVFTSALNEGRIEALNNSKDWYNVHKLKLDEEYQQRIAALTAEYEANAGKSLEGDAEHGYIDPAYEKYKEGLLKEEEAYKQSLANLSEKRAHMGNVDLIMNLPILLASNFFQFARFYANGFKTARKTFNIVGNPGKYTANTGKRYLAAELGKRGLAEGSEEISQRAASEISGDYYSTDVMNFYKSKTNREAEKETLDFMKSFADGINKTINDGSAWEEFLIGAMTGIMGVPRFRSMHNAQGKFQSPVTLYNAGYEKWKENKQLRADEAQLVDALNKRFNSEDFLNYYQGLIRHNRYQAAMNKAAQEGNEFDFKNSEHAQLVSDIIMFDKAGKLNDLMEAINVGNDTSEENLRSIVENTTAKDDSGKLVGPFAQYAALDSDGKIIANFGSEQDKKNMAAKLEENGKEITKTIEAYRDTKDGFLLKYGDRFTDDQLSDLTWMKLQLDNWGIRAEQMMPSIKDPLKHILGKKIKEEEIALMFRDAEGRNHADLTDLYKIADKEAGNLSDFIKRLQLYSKANDKILAQTLVNNPELVKHFTELIEKEASDIDTTDAIDKLNDLLKMGKAIDTYNAKLAEYLKTPQKLSEDQQKADDEIAEEATAEGVTNAKGSLNKATTLKEFKDTVNKLKEDNIEEVFNIDKAVQDLANEGNGIAKNYQELEQYKANVDTALGTSNLSAQTLVDASKALQNLANKANSLEELANPNFSLDEDIFDNGTSTADEISNRTAAAQYALNKAILKVNNSNKFKDRFSAAYRAPVEEPGEAGHGVDEETTGDSGVQTVPDGSKGSAPASTVEVAVGDISTTDVKEENKELNNTVEDPEKPKEGEIKQYYRPAVPEIHIEASKKGDFRPFDIVVKEREGTSFSEIYNYLVKKKVFEYLNSGNLHEGDELGFMIDPEFEKEVEGKKWHKHPTIFIVNKKDGHVVGSLDESADSVKKFEGLGNLEKRIWDEYQASRSEDTASTDTSRFYATPTTRVSKIMVGKVPYSEEERNLSEVLKQYIESGKTPYFGIVKSSALTTNGKIPLSDIMPLRDISNKEGRLYLLVPNGANKYSPVAVRVKHFNDSEFNPEDVNLQENPTMNSIKNAIKVLSEVTTEEDLKKAVSELGKVLYAGNLHINFVDSSYGKGIRFTKVYRDANGDEIYIENGKGERIRKEDSHTVDLTKNPTGVVGSFGEDGTFEEAVPTPVPQEEIIKEITKVLLSFNLPIQVSVSSINTTDRYEGKTINYNNNIINAGILTSNLTEFGTKSTWFTTDYFDALGNPHKAINPVYKANPNTSTPSKGAISGIPVTNKFDNKVYYVDLHTNTVRDSEGKEATMQPQQHQKLIDIAWAQKVYGNATEGINMIHNKAVTPSGKVLDRTTQEYLTEQEAQQVKQDIADREKDKAELVKKANELIPVIYENQKKVDKTRTDGEFYYVLEDDGEYHKYSRVHSRLGSNWVESPKQSKTLKDIEVQLSRLVMASPKEYNDYLNSLSKKFSIDLSQYHNKLGIKDRQAVLNTIRDKMSGTNSQRALDAGSAVDSIIRQYFTIRDVSKIVKPSNMSENAFIDLITTLNRVKSNMEQMGERFLADNIVLFQKYPDGTRVAGEVDILSIDKDGNFRIYDVKTSRYSFYDFTDRYGHKVNYFTTPSATQKMSAKDYYTLQLSAYKNLFESQYGVPVTKLAVMPFVLSYDKENVLSVQSEKGIPITYNPAVNVPLASNTQEESAAKPEESSKEQSTTNKAKQANKSLNLDEEEEDDDILRLREATKSSYELLDKEQELAWLDKVLPQLSREDRVKFVEGLIKVGKEGVYAWGKLDKGIMTLSDIAAKGTVYHEAFHVVFNYLLDPNDRNALLTEYSKKMPNADNIDLEEALAEDFREFVMQGGRDTRSLGRKIIDFFKSLFIKTKYWKHFRPSSIYYFRQINEGSYANRKISTTDITRMREEEYTQEMKDILAKAPRDAEGRLLAPNGEVSNLTERQYAQVRTKAFKRWFGDWENDPENASKVVDENGEPLVVYHGSRDNSFTIFDSTKNDKGQKGFFFTNDSTMASSYGKNPRGFFINSRDPYIIEGHNRNWNDLTVGVTDIAKDKLDSIRLFRNDLLLQLKEGKTSKEIYDFWNNKYFKLYDKYLALSNSFIDKIKKIIILNRLNKFKGEGNFLKSTRYTERVLELDSEDTNIIFKSITDYGPVFNAEAAVNMINNVAANVYVVTKPNNIKSATDNIGTFSTTNDDIRYRIADKNTRWGTLNNEEIQSLTKMGWTAEKFDSVSQRERDHALKCVVY